MGPEPPKTTLDVKQGATGTKGGRFLLIDICTLYSICKDTYQKKVSMENILILPCCFLKI
jgi:hypothetical protein